MDFTNFRWILVIAGIAILAGIFLFGNPDRKRKPRASRKRASRSRAANERVRQEPVLEFDTAQESTSEAPDHDERQVELAINDGGQPATRVEPDFGDQQPDGQVVEQKPKTPPPPPPDKIVTLFLQARDNHYITGVELLDVSLKSGLVFGEQGIFHRIHEEDLEPVFSMANLTNPGTFDKTAWNTMEIKGVTMFMTLPGPKNALDAWDSMLATSRRLAELLHADLLDGKREVFTRQRFLQIKDELREYERQQTNES